MTSLAKYIHHILCQPHSPSHILTSTMARTSQTVPQRQIETWATNKFTHPGNIFKPTVPRQTSAQVQEERDAKAQAKADCEEAK